MSEGKKEKYSFVPAEEDLPYEEDVLRNPYGLKSWLQYISFKASAPGTPTADRIRAIDVLYERALRALPGSYKLWAAYLASRTRRLRTRRPRSAAHEATVAVFERCLVYMHKMPRIWSDYLRFLASQAWVTRARRVFDRALRALPISQHEPLWELFLSFDLPAETAIAMRRRHLLADPGGVEDLVDLLVREGHFAEAAARLAKAVEDPRFSSRKGVPRRLLWLQLCTILCTHPTEVGALDVDAIVRAGIRKQQQSQDESDGKGDDETRKKKNAEFAPVPIDGKQQSDVHGSVGDLWAKLAEYYVRQSSFEKARDVFEEALESVRSTADFSIVWDAYTHFEDQLLAQTMTSLQEGDGDEEVAGGQLGLELRMARYERLIGRHALLANSVALRQNPHNVHTWFARVRAVQERSPDDKAAVAAVFTEALRTVDPKKATGKPHLLWASFARYYDEAGKHEQARKILEKGVLEPFKCVDDLASLWCDYVEMELRHGNHNEARELCRRATAKPPASELLLLAGAQGNSSAQKWLHKSVKLWSLYADLEESFGTFEGTKAVYEHMLELRVATPQTVISFAQFLEERGFFEESFRAYERGVAIFGFPHAMSLWVLYLTKFVRRYGGRKLERARDLFEQVLQKVPPEDAKVFYVMYANLEEEYGLARHAMAVYDRATRAVAEEDRYKMFLLYVARAGEFFGVMKTREIYERAIQTLPERHVRDASLRFASLERRLGEAERARAIYMHCAQFCNPSVDRKFWETWREFEVQHGNDDTFREMLRVRRSVQATYNTSVNLAALEMLQAAKQQQQQQAEEAKKRVGSSMEALERESKLEQESAADATKAKRKDRLEFTSGGTVTMDKPQVVAPSTSNPEAMDLGDEDGDADADGASGRGIVDVEEMPVPEAVLGGLKREDEGGEKPMGAMERLRRAGML